MGLAFRPQVREDAYSPAVILQSTLVAAGAKVTLEDPLYDDEELVAKGFTPGTTERGDIDAVILHTAHPEFTSPNFRAWRAAGIRAVLDGRAAWSRDDAEAAGLMFIGVGVGNHVGSDA